MDSKIAESIYNQQKKNTSIKRYTEKENYHKIRLIEAE